MKHKRLVYLDHAATTPLRAEAREAMLPYLGERFGNPVCRLHAGPVRPSERWRTRAGRWPRCWVPPERSRLHQRRHGVINAAIKGVAFAQQRAAPGNHIVTTAIEHHAVLHSAN